VLPELAGARQDARLERATVYVVRLDRRLRPRPTLAKCSVSVVSASRARGPRSLIALADSAIVSWRQPVRDCLEQRDQRRRGGEDHLWLDAVLDQPRILLERGA